MKHKSAPKTASPKPFFSKNLFRLADDLLNQIEKLFQIVFQVSLSKMFLAQVVRSQISCLSDVIVIVLISRSVDCKVEPWYG
jgi:hypothetical protein